MLLNTCWAQTAAIGSGHFHVVCSDGSVQSWGVNTDGEFGNGSNLNSNSPVSANSLTGIIAVAAGSASTVALKKDGTVWTWGGNLGNGTSNNSYIPIQVPTLSNIIAIAAAPDRSFALKGNGTVWGWGNNNKGALGNGTTNSSNVPVQASITNVIAIAAGGFYTLALKNDGTVWAWGDNSKGFLGNGTLTDSYLPIQVSNLTNIIAISTNDHSFALKNDGTLWAWGYNYYGQLGDGTVNSTGCFCKSSPIQLSLSDVKSIVAGWSHSIAVKNDGTVWTWGYNQWGQLGNGNNTNSTSPVLLSGVTGVKSVEAAFFSSLLTKSDGSVWTWGEHGNPTNGDTINRPMQILNLCTSTTNIGAKQNTDATVLIFPNPASNAVTISFTSSVKGHLSLDITDELGQIVYSESNKDFTGEYAKTIDLSKQPSGIYLVKIVLGSDIRTRKVIIE